MNCISLKIFRYFDYNISISRYIKGCYTFNNTPFHSSSVLLFMYSAQRYDHVAIYKLARPAYARWLYQTNAKLYLIQNS